jgi:MFS family permease
MTRQERKAWLVLLSVSFVQLFMFGPCLGTIGVLITPLIREFGWSHGQVSRIATSWEFGCGIFSLVAGYLLDRINARWVMGIGALIGGAGMLLGATIHSLAPLVVCYFLAGVGCALTTQAPMSVVAVNWFPSRRALAVGIAGVGTGIGMAVAPEIVTLVLLHSGWRMALMVVGAPMVLAVAPVALLLIHTRPSREERSEDRALQEELPGLEVAGAMLTASFWLILLFMLLSQTGVGAAVFFIIPYLISAGYSAKAAALFFGGQALMLSLGGVLLGALSDRYGPKYVLAASFVLLALSMMLLLGGANQTLGVYATLGWMILWGIDMSASVALPPLVAETLGMRRFGTLMGIFVMVIFAGQGLGPLLSGIVYDSTKGYTVPFEMAALLMVGAAVLVGALGLISAYAAGAPMQSSPPRMAESDAAIN